MADTELDDTKPCHRPRNGLPGLIADVLHEARHVRDGSSKDGARLAALVVTKLEEAFLWAQAAERGHL